MPVRLNLLILIQTFFFCRSLGAITGNIVKGFISVLIFFTNLLSRIFSVKGRFWITNNNLSTTKMTAAYPIPQTTREANAPGIFPKRTSNFISAIASNQVSYGRNNKAITTMNLNGETSIDLCGHKAAQTRQPLHLKVQKGFPNLNLTALLGQISRQSLQFPHWVLTRNSLPIPFLPISI